MKHVVLQAAGLAFSALYLAAPSFAADAAKNFSTHCAKCHGTGGKADTDIGRKQEIADFTSPSWKAKNSNTAIKETITYGAIENPKMKAYKDKLSPAEIDALVAYIRGLK